MVLDAITFVVLTVLAVAAAFVAVKVAVLPGKIAADRNHPQKDAIRVCGWLGLLTLGLMWPLALIWAYTRPVHPVGEDPAGSKDQASGTETAQTLAGIARRLEALEARMNAAPREAGENNP